MKLHVNGETHDLPGESATVRDLVEHLGYGRKAVAVEVNRHVVPKRDHESTALNEGDRVELVTLVGGG